MKHKEKYPENEFKQLIADVSKQTPILSDSETLLAETIKQLPKRPLPKPKRYFEFYRVALNAAAVFLIGLFIFQNIKDSRTSNNTAIDKEADAALVINFNNNPCETMSANNLFQYKKLYACYLENSKRSSNPFRIDINNLKK